MKKISSKIRFVVMLLAVTWMAGPLYGQTSALVVGTWKGVLEAANNLEIYFTIRQGPEALSATMSVPAQGARDLPVDRVTFDGLNLTLEVDALMMKYTGMLLRGTFSGTLTQYGISYAMALVKGQIPQPSRPQEPQPPYPYQEQTVVFHNERDGIDLAGTLTLPEGEGPFDAVVLVSGSGPQNRDEELMGHKPFLVLADALTRAGYAVLRYDDRGVGESGGTQVGATTEDLSYDAQAALAFLKGKDNMARVGILGHSEGAGIAFLVASRTSQCDFVISLAGPGVRGDQVLLAQQRAILSASGMTPAQLDQVEQANRQIFDRILASTANDEAFRQEILQMVGGDEATAAQLLDPWMYSFIRFSPEEVIRQVRVPVLAINGTKDLQVIASQNLPAIGKALQQAGNSQVTLLEMEGLNHLGQHCQSGHPQEYAMIEETIAPEILEAILEFLKK